MTVGAFPGSSGEASASLYLPHMSWPAIRDAVAGGRTTALLIAGSVEQHGPHLPCLTDTLYGIEFGVRAAARHGRMLVAPIVTPGCSDHHLGFPGTFSVTAERLVTQVEAHLQGLRDCGFRHVVLTSSHGGNFGPLADGEPRLRSAAAALGMTLRGVLDLGRFVEALRFAPAAAGLDQGVPAVQADLIETSIMLRIHPELVDMQKAEIGFMGAFDVQELLRTGLAPLTSNGVIGDPRGATPELGEAILARLEQYLLDAIAEPAA